MKLNTVAAAMVAAGLIQTGAVFAMEPERELAATKVSADQDKPVQQRTELGRLTEATPISGAVVNQGEIEHLQLVNNLLELGKRVPGISMIRNMRIPDGGKLYTENRIDGMRTISTNTSVLDEVDMANIERIDIITGPGSALYGSGSIGGTISVFTRQPPRDLQGRLSQEVGSWGFQRTQGNVGASTADGRIGFVLDGSTMDFDGWRRVNAAANQDSAAEHKHGVALKTRVRLTDTTNLTVGVDQLHYDYRWAGTLRMTRWEQDWRQSEAGTYGRSIDDYNTLSLGLRQMVGERGELNAAWARRTDDGLGYGAGGSGSSNNVICDDTGALAAPLAAGKTVKCRAVNNNSSTSTNTLKRSRAVSETSKLVYRHDLDLAKSSLYLGMETSLVTTDSATYNNAFNALQAQAGLWSQGTMTATGQGSLAKERTSTPFVHAEFSPVDKLRLHLGRRFDRITYSTDDRTAANKDAEKTYNAGVWKTGASYDLTPTHLVWGNWSETFNAPNISTLLDSSAKGTAGNTIGANLDPEHGVTRELGLRGRFPDLGLHYDAALFHTINRGYISNRFCTAAEQVALNAGATCTINENAGRITAKGLESMLSWAATAWLDLGATYTNARAYYDQYKTTTVDYTGKSYQAMPRHRLNLRLAVKPAAGWNIELERDYMSEYFVDTANSGTYARPTLYNLRASYRAKDWSFWLHAINLTSEKYATRVSYSTIAGQSVLAASAGQGNAGSYTPLTLRAGISYKF